jgi:RNA polymerase sigma-70 factor, ECF subfamily
MSTEATDTRARGVRKAPATGFRAQTSLDEHDGDPAIAEAVARAKSGDQEAIRFLHTRYKDSVSGYVLSMIQDQHEAEEVTEHVFLELISIIHKYEPHRAPFKSWLLRVARNAALDHLRRQGPMPSEEVYGPMQQADDSARELRWGREEAPEVLSEAA